MKTRSKAPARLVAVLALLAAAAAIVLVVAATTGGDDEHSKRNRPARHQKDGRQGKPDKPAPKVYTVQEGDTLSAIAHKTGVPLAQIERLNPDIDPQILVAGQELKLR
jgi:LysM repeat protein